MGEDVENEDSVKEQWFNTLLEKAITSEEHTVELVKAERYGVQVVVDNSKMFDVEGYPWETFAFGPVGDIWYTLSDDGKQKLQELYFDDNAH